MPNKSHNQPVAPECGESTSLGFSPAVLAKRSFHKKEIWCEDIRKAALDYDPWCDPDHPRTIVYKDVLRAYKVINGKIPMTPLLKSKSGDEVDLHLYFKIESLHRAGSFHARAAIYVLSMLTPEQRKDGILTASLGNWAMALSYEGYKTNISITVILPVYSHVKIVETCRIYGAQVILYGKSLTESRQKALKIIKSTGIGTYINGYDHPHVIAAAGTIAIELLQQLKDIDAILVPVGGGGLIAGIATVVKEIKPNILIYGIELGQSCCFFKALENEEPYKTDCSLNTGQVLAVPTAGYNAFHTARSLIDKMVLVEDDWISRALLHYVEEERLIAESAGAVTLAAILSDPNIVPELRNKNVICLLTGANIDNTSLLRALERAKAVQGRLLAVKITLPMGDMETYTKVLKVISNLQCNIIHYDSDSQWLTENDVNKFYMIVMCETRDLLHTCTVKRTMHKLFPDMCEFSEDAFMEKSICPCFPKLWSPL